MTSEETNAIRELQF